MKREVLILVLLVITSAFLSGLCIHEGHNWGGDFSLYISQAKAIVEGSQNELLELNKYTTEHSDVVLGPYLYPNGFPILLSSVYYFFGIDLVAMKIFCTGFFILCLPLIYFFFKPKLSVSSFALFLVAGIGLHESFLTFTDNVLSAFPFLFFLLLSFFMMERSRNLIGQIVLGGLIYYTFAIRDIGLALLPALFIYQVSPIILKQSKEKSGLLFHALPYLSFTFFLILRLLFSSKSGESRFDLFSLSDVYSNFVHYSDLISNYLFDSNLSLIFLIPMWAVIISGMVIRFKTDAHIIVFMIIVLIIYVIWPFEHVVRFLFPFIPFLLYFLIEGIQYLAKRVKMKYPIALFFIIFGFISFRGVKTSIEFSNQDSNTAYSEEIRGIYTFISETVAEDEIIGFYKPRVLRLFTDRNSIYETKDYSTEYLLLDRDTVFTNYVNILPSENYNVYKRIKMPD